MGSEEIDRDGRSPLHYAALEDDRVLVQELVAAGADVDLADLTGMTPLHFAAQEHALGAGAQDP